MTKFKFVGQFTNGQTSINVGGPDEVGGVTFHGDESVEVERPDLIARLSNNQEFKAVGKTEKVEKPEPPADQPTGRPHKDEIKALRDQYEFATGKKPFPGWSAEILREKLAAK